MRTGLYALVYLTAGVPALVSVLDSVLFTCWAISIRNVIPKIGVLGAIRPSHNLILGTTVDYVEFAVALALALLAGRRLIVIRRTRTFTPPEFRGVSYGATWLGMVVLVLSGATFLVTKSVVLTVFVLVPALWILWLSFLVVEISSVARRSAKFCPNSMVDTEAPKSSARGSP